MNQVVHGPGAWNDPDMLIVGNFGLSRGQAETQMVVWSLMSAPLIMSTDLRSIEPWARDLLLNERLVAINQDALGIMGKRFGRLDPPGIDLWSKPLTGDRTAFAFVNQDDEGTPARVSTRLVDIGLSRYPAYDLFETLTGAPLGRYRNTDTFTTYVNPSGSVFTFWAEPVVQ